MDITTKNVICFPLLSSPIILVKRNGKKHWKLYTEFYKSCQSTTSGWRISFWLILNNYNRVSQLAKIIKYGSEKIQVSQCLESDWGVPRWSRESSVLISSWTVSFKGWTTVFWQKKYHVVSTHIMHFLQRFLTD